MSCCGTELFLIPDRRVQVGFTKTPPLFSFLPPHARAANKPPRRALLWLDRNPYIRPNPIATQRRLQGAFQAIDETTRPRGGPGGPSGSHIHQSSGTVRPPVERTTVTGLFFFARLVIPTARFPAPPCATDSKCNNRKRSQGEKMHEVPRPVHSASSWAGTDYVRYCLVPP